MMVTCRVCEAFNLFKPTQLRITLLEHEVSREEINLLSQIFHRMESFLHGLSITSTVMLSDEWPLVLKWVGAGFSATSFSIAA